MIKIIPFQKIHQQSIDDMMETITAEFEVPISHNNSTKVLDVHKYWVALNKNEVIGTIAILRYKHEFSVLKNMFVKRYYRGKEFSVANLLLNKALDWCIDENIDTIYLGTMHQFKAAHKFYEKNDFKRIPKSILPSNFINNPLDDVFYKLNLSL